MTSKSGSSILLTGSRSVPSLAGVSHALVAAALLAGICCRIGCGNRQQSNYLLLPWISTAKESCSPLLHPRQELWQSCA